MPFLLIIVGLILIILSYFGFKKQKTSFYKKNYKPELKKMEKIEEKIDYLANKVEEVSIKLDQKSMPFSQVFYNRLNHEENDEYQKIRMAYQQGENIADIARKFKRGKGEIQLILNLKK